MNRKQIDKNKENQYFGQLPSLQFKPTTKKRVIKRPSPSKSSKFNDGKQKECKQNKSNPFVPRINLTTRHSLSKQKNAQSNDKNTVKIDYGKIQGGIIKRIENRRLASEYDNRRVIRASNRPNIDLNLMQNIIFKLGSLTQRATIRKHKTQTKETSKQNKSQRQYQSSEYQSQIVGLHKNSINQANFQLTNNNYAQTLNQSFQRIPDNEVLNPLQTQMRSNKQFSKTFSGHQIHVLGHNRNKSQQLSLTASANYNEALLKIKINQNQSQRLHQRQNRAYNFIKNKKIKPIIKTMSLNQEFQEAKQFNGKLKISDFQLGLCKGEDLFGKTYPARHIKSGFILCIKQISKRQVKRQLDKLIEYLKIISDCNSPYVIQFYGVFEQKNKIYILMQYFQEGDLYLKLKSKKRIEVKYSLDYLKNVAQGINQLHKNNIVYRNLKPENLSFIYQTCKISNLAWSSRVENQKNNYQGDIEYSAPQLILGSKYTKQCDVWGLGIFLFQMINGVTPCHNLSRKKTIHRILNDFPIINEEVSSHIKYLFQKLFIRQAEQRLSVPDLIKQIELTQNLMGHA